MKMLWLLSGLGVGAGVTYLLDPDKGAGRRDRVRESVAAYGRQTGVLLDETGQSLGRHAQAVLATHRLPCRHQPALEERRRPQGEAGGLSLGVLGWVGVGVGLGSLLEPQGDRNGAPGCVIPCADTGSGSRGCVAATAPRGRRLAHVAGSRRRPRHTKRKGLPCARHAAGTPVARDRGSSSLLPARGEGTGRDTIVGACDGDLAHPAYRAWPAPMGEPESPTERTSR